MLNKIKRYFKTLWLSFFTKPITVEVNDVKVQSLGTFKGKNIYIAYINDSLVMVPIPDGENLMFDSFEAAKDYLANIGITFYKEPIPATYDAFLNSSN